MVLQWRRPYAFSRRGEGIQMGGAVAERRFAGVTLSARGGFARWFACGVGEPG
jgi:hypothetical protein